MSVSGGQLKMGYRWLDGRFRPNCQWRRSWLVLVLLAMMATAHAEDPSNPASSDNAVVMLTMRLDGSVDVDRQGTVIDYRTDSPVPEALRANVDRAIRGWKFEPVVIANGYSAARVRMRLTLSALPTGDNYVARIASVVFLPADNSAPQQPLSLSTGPIKPSRTRRPRTMLGGIAARTLMAVKVGLNGRVEQVAVIQSSVMDEEKPTFVNGVMPLIEKSVVEALKQWRFDVDFKGATPTPELQTVLVAFCFNPELSGVGQDQGVWHYQSMSPLKAIPWLDAERSALAINVLDTDDGDVFPLVRSSPVQLRRE